jgi:hypothetical protein
MTSRILSFVALSGMLLAAGCSGGGAGSGLNGVTPSAPGNTGGAPSSAARGTAAITASFDIPEAAFKKLTQVGRHGEYLSPGTGGIDILMGNGAPFSPNAGASGTAQITGQVTDNAVYAGPAPAIPTAAGPITTVSVLSASYQNNVQPTVGQTFTIVDQNSTPGTTFVSSVFTISAVNANGTVLTGTFSGLPAASYVPPNAPGSTGYSVPSAQYPATTAFTQVQAHAFPAGSLLLFTQTGNANGQQFVVGSQNSPGALTSAAISPGSVTGVLPTSITGTGATGSYSYTFAPSSKPGYYTFTFIANGLKAATTYTLGVVTLDFAKNFVLSENQAAITTPAGGGTQNAAFTLRPVVNGVYIPAPAGVFPPADGSGGAVPAPATNTFETTVFATDELGYVIPDQHNSLTGALPDNLPVAGAGAGQGPILTIKPTTAGQLTFNVYTAGDQGAGAGNVLTSVTQAPVAPVIAPISTVTAGVFAIGNNGAANSDVAAANFAGVYAKMGTPTAPNSVNLSGATQTAGNPLNVICGASSASVAWQAVLNSATPGTATNAQQPAATTVIGFTLTPGTNYPAAGNTTITLSPVNCTPGIGAVIN